MRDLLRDLMADAVRQELPNASQGDPDQLLSVDDAAALFGMTPGALRKAAARGSIKGIRVGRRLRFRRSELLACDRRGS